MVKKSGYSLFPDGIDSFEYMNDISSTTLEKANKYQKYLSEGKFTEAASLINSDPELKKCVFTSEKYNRIADAVEACEKSFYDGLTGFIDKANTKLIDIIKGSQADGANKDSAGRVIEKTYFNNMTFQDGVLSLLTPAGSVRKVTIPDTKYDEATTGSAGLFSASDKNKLNGIQTGATRVIVDSSISSTSANPVRNSAIYAALSGKSNTNHGHSNATTVSSGFMSSGDKSKLDGIEAGAQKNTVLGVKGSKEGSYRTGNINISPANIGALPLTGGSLSGDLRLENSFLYTNMGIRCIGEAPLTFTDTKNAKKIYFKSESSNGLALKNIDSSSIVYFAVEGQVLPYRDQKYSLGNSDHRWSSVYSVKGTINTSDRRQKENIQEMGAKQEGLFMKLQPKSFKFIEGDRLHYGFISQDVEDAMNEIGMTSEEFGGFCKDAKTNTIVDENGKEIVTPVLDENGNQEYMYSIRYSEFIALNTHMIQKLIKENEELKKRLDVLETAK